MKEVYEIMIVYIIPGKTRTVQAALDYVSDDNKTAKNFNELRSEYEASPEVNDKLSFEEYYVSTIDIVGRKRCCNQRKLPRRTGSQNDSRMRRKI